MTKQCFLKTTLSITVIAALCACSPGKKNAEEVSIGSGTASIIGGKKVQSDDLIGSSTVALLADIITTDGQRAQSVCTGSLLRSNVVLTAGHCLPQGPNVKEASVYVVFGKDLRQQSEVQVRLVTDHVLHERYGQVTELGEDSNDIALMKFSGSLPEGYKLAELLEDESLVKPESKVTLAGYGFVWTDGEESYSDNTLRRVDVNVIDHIGKTEVVLDQSQGKGACHGDSGGPAFLEVDGKQLVWGITSRGAGRDGVDDCSFFSIYTKVKSHSEFINTALEKLQ